MIKELKSLALSIVDEQDSDFLFEVAERLEKLEKALDRACYELSMHEEAITFDNSYHDKDIWKEWCLGE